VRVTVDSRPDESFAGRVSRVASFVLDVLEQNRTVEIEVEFDDEASLAGVLPGTSADAEIILETREDVLRIPASAVAEGNSVLVLADGLLEQRIIETGLRNWRWAEATGGLAEGERVVVARNTPDIKAGAMAEERE
jgi:HlyD family secretion protein